MTKTNPETILNKPKVLLVGKNHQMIRTLSLALHRHDCMPVPVTSLPAAIQMLDYTSVVAVIIDMTHLDFEIAAIFGALQDGLIQRGLPTCAIVPDDLAPEEMKIISEMVPAMVTHKGNFEDSANRAVENMRNQTEWTMLIQRRRGPKILDAKTKYYPLPEVMQFHEQCRSDGMLELADEQHLCELYYKGGLIYHAQVDEQVEGMDAIFLMLHIRDGTFTFYNDTSAKETTINNGSTMIVLDALRRKDETMLLVDGALAKREQHRAERSNRIEINETEND